MKTKTMGWLGIGALLLSASVAEAAGVSRKGKWKKDDKIVPPGVNLNVSKPSDLRVVSAKRFISETRKNQEYETDAGFSLAKASKSTINGTYVGTMPCKAAYRFAGGSTSRKEDCEVKLTLNKSVPGQTSDWRDFVLEIEVLPSKGGGNVVVNPGNPGGNTSGPLGAGNNGAKSLSVDDPSYPKDYSVKAKKRSEPLAAQIVFDAMVDISRKYHESPYHGTKVYDPLTGYPQNDMHLKISKGTVGSCLANTANHWSDLIIHYYCQHGYARSCYTGNARNGVPRDKLVDKCKSDRDFKWVVDGSFTSGGNTYKHVDVFSYVMRSQTFGFDETQINDMLNKYYGVSGSSCSKRPLRGIDPRDGTHCKVGKKIDMKPVGR